MRPVGFGLAWLSLGRPLGLDTLRPSGFGLYGDLLGFDWWFVKTYSILIIRRLSGFLFYEDSMGSNYVKMSRFG